MRKLELDRFIELISVVEPFPVEVGVPMLAGIMNGFDEIVCTKPPEYEKVCDAFRWLGLLKDYGKQVKLGDKTIENITGAFDGERKQVVAEWIIRLTLKR